jgi:hypothetical protein
MYVTLGVARANYMVKTLPKVAAAPIPQWVDDKCRAELV